MSDILIFRDFTTGEVLGAQLDQGYGQEGSRERADKIRILIDDYESRFKVIGEAVKLQVEPGLEEETIAEFNANSRSGILNPAPTHLMVTEDRAAVLSVAEGHQEVAVLHGHRGSYNGRVTKENATAVLAEMERKHGPIQSTFPEEPIA